ncbi:ATP-dependent Clp protease ATP-binding subunit ClpB [Metamycoplasma subdolum]|uniref:ATP-dependent Clp protease ATP-binding subunit ClpB n=1 Tax=Metamycoplasma subdolum TaxID=92407 RepID=A0A3M0A400_9BACT|nr:AAA family ATPase [Metamycoplasma subdolum]RMA79114.1 ATP-dependent Clp protease ATP-binding subunit ClpB [Metamycoplasma subdolum]WPB50637.1 AAA family ATPase [Metamycoplasma subdolum]
MNATWEPNDSRKAIEKYGKDLTKLAQENKLEPVINRDDEIRTLMRVLSRKMKNNPVLVGEPGVGKTAVVEGLARKIVEGKVPTNLKGKKIIEIDLAAMVAGTQYRGMFEERLKGLIDEVVKSDGEIILFIDEIHNIIGSGAVGENTMDAANILKPMMARGTLHLIGATTLDEYRKHIEKDAAFERRMQKVIVSEPSIEDTVTILRGIKERYETFHKVKIEDEALVAAANLSSRYISDRFLPDKAIDLIDEAASNIRTEMNYLPEPLEKVEQKIAQLEIEKAGLLDSDKKSKTKKDEEKINEINKELVELKKDKKELEERLNSEKADIQKISSLKQEIDDSKAKLALLQSEGKYVEASKIMYVLLPSMQSDLQKLETKLRNSKNRLIKEVVDAEEIANIVSRWTKIPVTKLLESQREKLLNLKETLAKRVKGQDEALEKVSEAIQRAKANINDPNRPIGSFIFLGPTGVGKTEVARSLAEALFDNENHIIRLDMSEYMEKQSGSKMIGSAPGYVGFEEGGQLTEKVRRLPYSIVLFDEIEKAHPDVLNLLLQILDNGQLTDSKGRSVNFRNTIIIMTSNIGSELILDKKANYENLKRLLLTKMKPEFINRIDEIIMFNSLDQKVTKSIVQLEINKLKNRVNKNQSISLEVDQEVIDFIAKEAYDPNFGARPIKRYIQKNIENKLAILIIDNKVKEGDKVFVFLKKDEIVVSDQENDLN